MEPAIIEGKLLTKKIKDFHFEPSFNRVVCTLNRRPNEKGIVTTEAGLDDVQFVIAAGETSKYKAKDKIVLDFKRLGSTITDPNDSTQTMQQINVTPFAYNGEFYAIIFDNDILGKFTK